MLFKHMLNILPVNFQKPWWQLFWNQKALFSVILAIVSFQHILWTFLPFTAAKLFELHSASICLAFFAVWLCLEFLLTSIRVKLNNKFQLQCIHSIYQNTHQYLLTVDPHYHIYQSSGAMLAKIERAARSYEDLADHLTYEFVPLIAGIIAVAIAMCSYSFALGGITLFFITSILAIGYYFSRSYSTVLEGKFIVSDDRFKATASENLNQIPLIRSTFASEFRQEKLNKTIENNMKTESRLWFSYSFLFLGLNLLYLVSLATLSFFLIWKMNTAFLSAATALGLFLAYVQSSREITRFGRLLRKITKSKTAIVDLFEFMSTFGKQTFPVLGPALSEVPKNNETVIQATNISFDYGKATLFNGHTLALTCSKSQPSKLYGIIGPSGSGKTTILSILGGQLKPIVGTITINGMNMYEINDAMRRQLVVLQGQVASTLGGTLKENMLLGLPDDHGYTDQNLLTILDQVGLLSIFAQYDGLSTELGEGGLSMSGGQRQRLNFAGLYLRARFYKPLVVLIDEPTSSLDEISEAAITLLIEKLAQDSVTLVVAHRLKTIEKAVGIIDLSLLSQSKTITTYPPNVLLEKSVYYKELVHGIIEMP